MAGAGLGAVAGSAAWGETRRLNHGQAHANNSVMVPETYVMAPMTIPSGGFLRRWLLVNTPERRISKIARLTLHTNDGRKLSYEVPIVM